ncbi:transcription initiation factor TFIID subunit 4-like isoform X2 [Heterodontus francisci]|uniref:transcription initiation factor TFIID subunit 4-like isoform X2 n=1 Tax=Heterodontus francisci TaxID=7792 RepID=UPI00355C0641
MAAGSDPLEDLFLSEVDEKAVSDLVGSLESQLAGRSAGASPQGDGRPGPAGGSVSADGQRRLGGMAPSQLEEKAAAAAGPAPGFGKDAPVGPGLSQRAAASSKLPSSPTSHTSAAGARASGGATPGTGRLPQSYRPQPPPTPPSPAPGISSPAPPLGTNNPGGLDLVTGIEPPVSNHLPTPHKAPRPLPQAVNGLVANCSSPGSTAALHLSAGTPPGTCNRLPTTGANSTFDSSSLTVPTATSINSSCSASQNGSLNPHFLSLSQASVLMCTVSTPTTALQRPPVHTVNASNVSATALSQNGIAPLSNVNASGLLQVGTRTGIRRGATMTQLANHQIAAVSSPISNSTATNTDSTSQSKLLPTQSQPVTLGLLNNPTASVAMTNTSNNQLQCTVTNSLPVVSVPVNINAVAKPAVNMIAQSHVGITKVVTSVPGIIHASATQPQPPRPGIGASPRIVAPQLIIRPQQQPTVQLASGFTIPPGMILVRTESGQLVMVPQQALAQAQAQRPGSISPRPSAPTSGTTFRLASTQAMTISSIRAGHPMQAKVVQPATTPLNVTSVAASQPACTAVSVAISGSTSAPQTIYTTTISGVGSHHAIMSQAPSQIPASPQPPLHPQPVTKTRLQVQPQVIPSSPLPGTPTVSQVSLAPRSAPLARAGQEMQENVKKCKNFLATLIKLASHSGQSADTSRNVKGLVQDLLDSKIEPEEFTNRLQSELKSSPQPYLVPFLKKSLPALRQSLVHNQQCILQVNQKPQHPQATSTQQSTATVATVVAGPSVRMRQPITDNAVSGTNTVTQAHINLAQQGRSTHLIVQSPVQTVKKQSIGLGAQVRLPVVITPSIKPVGKASLLQGGKSLSGSLLQDSANQKNKLNDPGGGSFRDDDDINDVTSMAGVNLSEESANILAINSNLIGTHIRSCKDEAFLASGPLHKRILETAKRFGITDVPIDIVNTVSLATQERLKLVIGKLTSIAQHRMETHKDHEWYEQATDVRAQLKFFEHLERLEKQRKDDQEREILLKAAKSRSRQEDPEHARLKQKAKEMQQQELAQMRQRDANLTALAAIGPRKKRKLDSPGPQATEVGMATGEGTAPTLGPQAGYGPASSRQYTRQRVTRVNLRDFIFYMEQERDTRHSLVLYRALLK